MLIVDQICKALWVQLTAPAVNIMTADYKKVPSEKRSGTLFGTSIVLRPQKIPLLKPHIAAPPGRRSGDSHCRRRGLWLRTGIVGSRRNPIQTGNHVFGVLPRSPVTPIGLASYPLGIWNGVGPVNGQRATWAPPTRRRDAIPDKCSINASPTSYSAVAAQTSIAPFRARALIQSKNALLTPSP